MKKYNILILSAGRRVELIRCFQKAAQKLNIKSNIVAGDCSLTAPGLYFADKKIKLEPIKEEEKYITSIISACKKEDIALIVPTIDTDLLLLARNKSIIEELTHAKLLISDIGIIKICRDKIKTQQFFEKYNFHIPRMYSKEELNKENIRFPLFIKPKSGSSSVNTFIVNDRDELDTFQSIVKDAIVQDFIQGDEYTVDVFLDFESNVISIVPRLRIATRSGEISKGRIVKDREIIQDILRLMSILKPIGHITVQLMKTEKGIEYIEINPRFGGGAPMSIQSGADSCEYLYKLLMGEDLQYNENYKDNITFLRFDDSICINDKMEIVKW